MRHHLISIAVLLAITFIASATENNEIKSPCESKEGITKTKCETKVFKDYLKCIEKNKTNRNKRQTCGETITPEQVQICNGLRRECMINCNADDLCETECPICPTLVHIPIDSDNTIDISAPVYADPSKPMIDRTIIVEGDDGTFQKYHAKIDADRKITTIIKLTNIINNTNIIDVPTNINSTNVNHIHIYQNDTTTPGKYGLGETSKGQCCMAVRRKSCRSSSSGMRCQHKKQKVCGRQCTAQTIHAQTRKRCNQHGDCRRRTAYVPQPRPRCHHVEYWPYVNCGGRQEQYCEGCYDHYGYGYDNYYGRGRRSSQCNGCYDDGFDYGPTYRRGPVLRPSYYHEPPCHITGDCYEQNYRNDDCGYGCFGNDQIDPAWGNYGPQYDQYEDDETAGSGGDFQSDRPMNVFPDDDYEYDITPSKKDNDTETDWGVPIQKCKVISDEGTISIKNCTVENPETNPYAVAPVSHPYYEPVDYLRHRDQRRPQGRPYGRRPTYDDEYDDYIPYLPREHRSTPRNNRANNHRQSANEIIYDDDDNALPRDNLNPDSNYEDEF